MHPTDCLICQNDPTADCNVVEIDWICSDFYTPGEFCAMFPNRIKYNGQNSQNRAEFAQELALVLQNDLTQESYDDCWTQIVDFGIVYHNDQWWHIYQDQDFYLYRTNDQKG